MVFNERCLVPYHGTEISLLLLTLQIGIPGKVDITRLSNRESLFAITCRQFLGISKPVAAEEMDEVSLTDAYNILT